MSSQEMHLTESVASSTTPKQLNAIEKLRLLLWKNYLIQIRHKLHTVVDLLLPICFFAMIVYLNTMFGSMIPRRSQTFRSQRIDTGSFPSNEIIYFSPNNTIFNELMKDVGKLLQLKPSGVDSIKNIEEELATNEAIAVDFHHSKIEIQIPEHLSYALRLPGKVENSFSFSLPGQTWQTNRLFPQDLFADDMLSLGKNIYFDSMFLVIQNAITKAYIKSKNETSNVPTILMQQFPIPIHNANMITVMMIPIMFLSCFLYPFVNNVRYVTNEKEKQLKESMKIMGLSNWMQHFSWFIRAAFMLMLPIVVITVLFKVSFGGTNAIFPQTDVGCLLLFFIGFSLYMITFGFFISSMFTKTRPSVVAAFLLWYITAAPFYALNSIYDDLAGWLKLLTCLMPNTAVGFGLKLITRLEYLGVGLNWSTAFQTTSIYDNLTVATVFGFLISDAILLFLLAVYVENVFPGKYSVAKPWNFFLTKAYWRSGGSSQQSEIESPPISQSNSVNIESEPTHLRVGIAIRNLTKKFTSDKAAVDNLSLNIYEDQITCLLGQNGAGKTTAISMLTAMIEPTSGTAFIDGHDIRSEMDLARDSMGFCPQHNILFDDLTVREHIIFYSCLKGLTNEQAEAEVQKYLPLLDLQSKSNALSTTLSGGMKRKLSVVIALCGQSKIVFLDEPTSGMDPGARRDLWDILLAEKKDRAILLTTHFMDEADVLSDRIAILANGELKCAGSSFFLKKRFGTGYHLICVKTEHCDSNLLTQRLQMHISEIQLESENDTELSYILPEDKTDAFQCIFEDLERNKNLQSFGVSLTTLEEIFLKIASLEDEKSPNGTQNGDSQTVKHDQHFLLNGAPLLFSQASALFKKRFICWLRSWISFSYYNVSAILILASIIFQLNNGNQSTQINQSPVLDISLNPYKSPYGILLNSNTDVSTKYKTIIQKSSAELIEVDGTNMTAKLFEMAELHPKEYKFQHIMAARFFNDETAKAYFNGDAIHSAPLALNLMHNAIIKANLGDRFSISVQNAPFKSLSNEPSFLGGLDLFAFMLPTTIGFVMCVLSPSYISFHIKEKQTQARFMQYASGANLPIFWAVSIVWDLLTSLITTILIVALLAFGQHKNLSSASELAIAFVTLFSYNFGMMSIICLLSLIFSKPTTGMNVVSMLNIIFLFAFMGFTFAPQVPKIISSILWFYPLCTLVAAFLKIGTQDMGPMFTGMFPAIDTKIGMNILSMFVTGIIAYVLLLVIEYGALKWVISSIMRSIQRTGSNDQPSNIDSDVLAEKDRVNQMTNEELRSQAVVMKDVSKFYGKLCAVDNISLAIKSGECFGLLGNNGAGKSSIFNMLTGQTVISAGQIFTQGFNQQIHLQSIYKIIGYCPQFDALLDGLTCRETMTLFSQLRGIPSQNVKSFVENTARSLDFIEHIDKEIKQLSGGNKRKLSSSLSMIGNLSVILLDEPTTGMDPATKRNLWNVVTRLRESGKSIVLTSHSMEECEVLCTRLTVIVNGKSKCLGSSQHLKNKFCKGFELKIKVITDDGMLDQNVFAVKNFVVYTFSGAVFREEYQGILTYSVPIDNIRWSSVFGIMENAKKTLGIQDYSVTQNTIEQVVLTLLKDQIETQQP